MISESLMTNTTLAILWLRHNNIGADGTMNICESLMNNTTLTMLNLMVMITNEE